MRLRPNVKCYRTRRRESYGRDVSHIQVLSQTEKDVDFLERSGIIRQFALVLQSNFVLLSRERKVVKISGLLEKDKIRLSMVSTDKKGAIRELGELLRDSPAMVNYEEFIRGVFDREEVATTGVGDEMAIPHARTDAVKEFVIAVGRSEGGIDFGSSDGKPARLIFLLATPKNQVPQYLQILAHLARLLKKREAVR